MSSESETTVSTTTPTSFSSTTKEFQSHSSTYNIGFETYIIILFSATIIVLIWSFFVFFFFSRGGRSTECRNHSTSTYRSSMASATTNSSFKSDSPPQYDTAINSKEFPSVIILDPRMLEVDPPTYQDVVKLK